MGTVGSARAWMVTLVERTVALILQVNNGTANTCTVTSDDESTGLTLLVDRVDPIHEVLGQLPGKPDPAPVKPDEESRVTVRLLRKEHGRTKWWIVGVKEQRPVAGLPGGSSSNAIYAVCRLELHPELVPEDLLDAAIRLLSDAATTLAASLGLPAEVQPPVNYRPRSVTQYVPEAERIEKES